MKKLYLNSMWFINGMMTGVIASLTVLWLFYSLIDWASAATYNVFFNNVEQGPNSVANPTLQISGGKKEKSIGESTTPVTPPVAEASVPAVPAPEAPVIDTPNTRSTAALPAPVARTEEKTSYPLRLSFLADSFLSHGDSVSQQPIGGMLRASYFPLRDFGLSIFGATGADHRSFYGGELEFNPFHLSVFGLERFLDLGLTAGMSSLGTSEHSSVVLGGLQAELNFGSRFALSAALRTNLSDRGTDQYLLGDAGISVRF